MKRKMKIIIVVFVILTFISGGIIITKLLTKGKIEAESKINDNFEIGDKETNSIIQEESQNKTEIAQIDNIESQNIIQKEDVVEKEQKKNTNESIKSHTQEEKSKNIISNNKSEEIISTANKEEIQKVKENTISSNVTSEKPEKEESSISLANTTYRRTNTEVLPEIKKILEDEIKKDKELVDFGTTVITTDKSNAYNNTRGFTYMFVNEIEKGKVEGNYVKFEQRVKNNVGAFGKYYIYAEDEFVYNSEGKNPKWSQTLVWIYVRF